MNGDCTQGTRNEQRIIALEARSADIEEINREQWTAINEARKQFEDALREIGSRLPNWAVVIAAVAGTLFGAIIGVLATLLAMK